MIQRPGHALGGGVLRHFVRGIHHAELLVGLLPAEHDDAGDAGLAQQRFAFLADFFVFHRRKGGYVSEILDT